MDLSNARFVFPDLNTRGPIHAQFTDFSQFTYGLEPLADGHWIYFIKPSDIAVEGSSTGLDIACPNVPVGVGQIESYRVCSVGPFHYQLFDAVGYVMAPTDAFQTCIKAC